MSGFYASRLLDCKGLIGYATGGNVDMVKTLLACKTDVNCRSFQTPPLFAAASSLKSSCKKIVQVLLDNKADVNYPDVYGRTPLFGASARGRLEHVQILLQHKANVNQATNEGDTPLLVSTHYGGYRSRGILSELVRHKADPNATSWFNDTPLYSATAVGDIDGVRLLLQHKANVNQARRRDQQTPLHVASDRGHSHIVRVLLDAGADQHAIMDNGKRAIDVVSDEITVGDQKKKRSSTRAAVIRDMLINAGPPSERLTKRCWREWARALCAPPSGRSSAGTPHEQLREFFAHNPGSRRWIGTKVILFCRGGAG